MKYWLLETKVRSWKDGYFLFFFRLLYGLWQQSLGVFSNFMLFLERKYFDLVTKLLDTQVGEMKSMHNALRKMEGTIDNSLTVKKQIEEKLQTESFTGKPPLMIVVVLLSYWHLCRVDPYMDGCMSFHACSFGHIHKCWLFSTLW